MASNSPLEDLLQSEISEGRLDSEGAFTLERSKAIEKLAAFQLPGPNTWAAKLVQAAVASGLAGLQVRLGSKEIHFYFEGESSWSLAEVERAFYEPEPEPRAGLNHLKQGLWNVGLSGRRPFLLIGPGWEAALYWDGQTLSRRASLPQPVTTLSVSHRSHRDERFWKPRAASLNAELLLELTQRAFVCPIPLLVDGRRLDSLQASPHHGLSPRSYPFEFGFLGEELPTVKIPQATLGAPTSNLKATALEKMCVIPDSVPEHCSLICIATAHLERVNDEQTQGWRAYRHASWIYWVVDGVVVDVRAFAVGENYVSLALIASAQGLALDLSGFSITIDSTYRSRLTQIHKLSRPFVNKLAINFEEVRKQARNNGRKAGMVILAGGIGLFLVEPVSGTFLTLTGLVQTVTARPEMLGALNQIEEALNWLRQDWQREL